MQGIAFLHRISRGYNFRTVETIKDFGKRYSKSKMITGIKKCINMYHARGLQVSQLNIDNECECIEEEIRPTRLNIVAADEHVSNVEQSTRTAKECAQCQIHHNPYKRYPRAIVTGCVVKSVKI